MGDGTGNAVCPKCGIVTTNLGRHLRRKRCEHQHFRKTPKG